MRWQRGEEDVFAVGHGCEQVGLRVGDVNEEGYEILGDANVEGCEILGDANLWIIEGTVVAGGGVVGFVVREIHRVARQIRVCGDAGDGGLCKLTCFGRTLCCCPRGNSAGGSDCRHCYCYCCDLRFPPTLRGLLVTGGSGGSSSSRRSSLHKVLPYFEETVLDGAGERHRASFGHERVQLRRIHTTLLTTTHHRRLERGTGNSRK